MYQIEELLREADNMSVPYPKDYNTESEVARFSPNIRNYFEQLAGPEAGASDFYLKVKALVESSQRFFEAEPTFYRELWIKRRDEYLALDAVINTTYVIADDRYLFTLCRKIAFQEEGFFTNLFLALSEWNSLPGKIRTILNDSSLTISLSLDLMKGSKEAIKLKYKQLVCDYQIVYKKLQELKLSVDSKNSQNYCRTIVYYLDIICHKQRELEKVMHHRGELEKQRDSLETTVNGLNREIEGYKEELRKMARKTTQLLKSMEEANRKNKVLSDENRLLEKKVARLNIENEVLKSAVGQKEGGTGKRSQPLAVEIKEVTSIPETSEQTGTAEVAALISRRDSVFNAASKGQNRRTIQWAMEKMNDLPATHEKILTRLEDIHQQVATVDMEELIRQAPALA